MLVLHQVLIDCNHLLAGPGPVIRGSFVGCLDRNPAQHQTTISDDPRVLPFIDHRSVKLRIFISPHGFPTFPQPLVGVGLVVFPTDRDPNPAMHKPRRGFGSIKAAGRCPRFAARSSFASFACARCSIGHRSHSFTYLAYSSRGTPSFFAIATCDGVSLTVLRPGFAVLRDAEAPAEATGALPPDLAVGNFEGNSF